MLEVARTPSYLKGLVDTRARAAGEVLRYRALADEFNLKVAKAQAELKVLLAQHELSYKGLASKLSDLGMEIDAFKLATGFATANSS